MNKECMKKTDKIPGKNQKWIPRTKCYDIIGYTIYIGVKKSDIINKSFSLEK